jgi:hypothetical protein
LGRVALILAVAALVLGVSALGVSLGAYGSSQGNGPGVIVSHATFNAGGGLIPHGSCQNVTSLILKINVSGPGTVVVSANVQVTLYHSGAYYAAAGIYVSNASTSCPGAPVLAYIDSGAASGTYIEDVSAMYSFAVTTAGTDSFYVTGYDYSTGTDHTEGGFVNMVAIFYPTA